MNSKLFLGGLLLTLTVFFGYCTMKFAIAGLPSFAMIAVILTAFCFAFGVERVVVGIPPRAAPVLRPARIRRIAQ
jgi:hypothetical protein